MSKSRFRMDWKWPNNTAPHPYIDTLSQIRRRLAEQAAEEIEHFDIIKESWSRQRASHSSDSSFQDNSMERLKDTAWRLAQVHSAIVEHEKLQVWERLAGSIVSEVGVVGRKMEALPAMLDELLSRFGK